METDERIVDILAEMAIFMDSTVNCGVISQMLVIFLVIAQGTETGSFYCISVHIHKCINVKCVILLQNLGEMNHIQICSKQVLLIFFLSYLKHYICLKK